MTTLITGGAGFIGSRLALRLIADGEPIVILDNFDSYYDPKIKRENIAALGSDVIVVEGDVRDTDLIANLFAQHQIDRVAHLGGMSGVRYSMDKGRLYADINTVGSVSLMDEARKHGVSVFVLASTSNVYGDTAQIPFVEDDPAVNPLSPYPASKRAAEIFAYSYYQLFSLNINVLRFFNVYGPHGRPDMMPIRAIEAILHDRTIDMFDGGALQRDWTYIDDIVDGIVAALNRPLGYAILNLGYGAPITFSDFIHIYEGLIGKKAITQTVSAPLTEPKITYCDHSRAAELLGFAPKMGIQEGLERTWEWYCQRYSIQRK